MKKVKMKRPLHPLSVRSVGDRSTCRLDPWKYGNSIRLDASVRRGVDEFIASAAVPINKSIGADSEVQMVKSKASYLTLADGDLSMIDLETDNWREDLFFFHQRKVFGVRRGDVTGCY